MAAVGGAPLRDATPLFHTRIPFTHAHTHTTHTLLPAADALAHPYFDSVRSQYPAEDPLLPTGPDGLNCAFESAEMTVKDYLRLIEEEERSFRAEQLLHARTGPAGGAAAGGGGGI